MIEKKKKTPAPRNKFERKIERFLKKLKVRFTYEAEKLPYILSRHYIPDFVVTTPLGKIYIELKGHLRREDKAKMVAVKKTYPNLDIRVLFYSSNKSYIKWAERNGFRYAIADIPEEWLKGL